MDSPEQERRDKYLEILCEQILGPVESWDWLECAPWYGFIPLFQQEKDLKILGPLAVEDRSLVLLDLALRCLRAITERAQLNPVRPFRCQIVLDQDDTVQLGYHWPQFWFESPPLDPSQLRPTSPATSSFSQDIERLCKATGFDRGLIVREIEEPDAHQVFVDFEAGPDENRLTILS